MRWMVALSKQKTTKSLFLRKASRNSASVLFVLPVLLIGLTAASVIRVETVRISSKDGLQLTADEYLTEKDNPYILLFHEQESSRGEFTTIAKKLCKMDYNCLAVDLRNGGSGNNVSNESYKRSRDGGFSMDRADVEKDILAAIAYARSKSEQPVILFGSGANASLSLKLASENDHVRAVVALSPGEYYQPQISIQDTITGMRKPVFASSSMSEMPYLQTLVSGIDDDYLTLFEPRLGEGARGSASLANKTENHSEYWLALLLFFKELV